MRDEAQFTPIFIVGSARSGTSALVLALREAGFRGYNEGHLAPLIGSILREIDKFTEERKYLSEEETHLIHHIRPDDLKEAVGQIFASIYRACHATPPRPHWRWSRTVDAIVEKTADAPMIKDTPVLQSLWPRARFIFAKRRGIENVISRVRKFPEVSFEDHCTSWAACMNAWLEVRQALANKIEVDQMDIATEPRTVAARIADFLGVDSAAENEIAQVFIGRHPERLTKKYAPSSLSELGWTEAEKRFFRDSCGHAMEAYGYQLDI